VGTELVPLLPARRMAAKTCSGVYGRSLSSAPSGAMASAVLDLPEVQGSAHLEATVPRGDAESLQRLRERTDDMATRAAGSSALVDADLAEDQ
jgi:hypothetical protein